MPHRLPLRPQGRCRAGRALLVVAAALLLPGAAGPARAEAPAPVVLFLPPSPLSSTPDGSPSAFVRSWVELVGGSAGVPIELRVTTFDRAWVETQRRPDACIWTVARTAEREPALRWVLQLGQDRVIVVAKADDTYRGGVDGLDGAAGGAIAAPDGYMRGSLEALGIRHVRVLDHGAGLRMVAAGRARFAVTTAEVLDVTDRAIGPLREVAELRVLTYWMGCARDFPDSLAARLDAAYAARIADGSLLALVARAKAAAGAEAAGVEAPGKEVPGKEAVVRP